MADSGGTQNSAFNALLSRLTAVASELAQQYQADVQAALNENKELRLALGSAGKAADGQNGVKASPSEASASLWGAEANETVPREGTLMTQNTNQEVKAAEKPSEIQGPPASQPSSLLQSSPNDVTIDSEDVPSPSPSKKSVTRGMSNVSSITFGQSQGTKKTYFLMRSPYIDQREFDLVTLQDVMPVEMYDACLIKSIDVDFEITKNEADVIVGGGFMSSFVIHPESRARGCWVLLCMALLMYDLVMVPVDVCFDMEETTFSEIMDVTAAAFWTIDIVFTFFVGIRHVHQHTVEMNTGLIARAYIKSWLIFDILLVAPEWVTMAISDDGFSGGQVSVFRMARWGRLMRLLRMARILRLGKLKPLLRRLIYVFNISKVYLQLLQALSGLSLGLIAFVHILSCFWYAIGNASDDGWVEVNGYASSSVGEAYVASVHWTFSRLHGLQSYNEIRSATEMLLDALLIFLSLILAAYYNGTVLAIALTSANASSFNLWRLSVLFVQKHRISEGLDMKMAKFLECSCVGGKMETVAEENQLLDSLPKTLQYDLLFEARAPFLASKPFLQDMLAAKSRVVHQICNEAVKQKVYVDGEVVFASGDACYGMLFITSGLLFYIIEDSNGDSLASIQEKLYNPMSMGPLIAPDSDTRELGGHSSVNEPVLWTSWTQMGSLLTIEEATALIMSPQNLSQVLKEHREIMCYACKYARRFLWVLNRTEDDIDDMTSFPDITLDQLDMDMFEGTEFDHFMFLSHYKVEAGTEATLMRDLFQDILRENPNHSANNLRSPIFVDSEDLQDLSKLTDHVIGSTALVLLLTPGVLSRPWCLVEIVTAVREGVNIVPVEIQRPGSRYNYPNDEFYANILNGKFLEKSAEELLESEGMSLIDVEKAIRKVFLKIAVPFSPHKTKGVREAELYDILSRCGGPGQDTPKP